MFIHHGKCALAQRRPVAASSTRRLLNRLLCSLAICCSVTSAAGLQSTRWLTTIPAPGIEFLPYPEGSSKGFIFSNEQAPEYGASVRFVNTSRGNLTFQWIDLLLPGPPPFQVARVYDSDWVGAEGVAAQAAAVDFGPGWRLRPGDFLILPPGGVELTAYPDDGTRVQYARDPEGLFLPAPGARPGWNEIVALEDGTLHAALDGGVIKTFAPSELQGLYLLAQVRDASGNWLQLRRQHDHITRIESSSGAVVEFLRQDLMQGRRTSGWNRIVMVNDNLGRSALYRYDNEGRLYETVTPAGEQYRLRYDRRGRLLAAEDIAGVVMLEVRYRQDGRVKNQRRYQSRIRFDYDDVLGETIVTGAEGRYSRYVHDVSGRMTQVTGSAGVRSAPVDAEALLDTREYREGCNPLDESLAATCPISVPSWMCFERCVEGGQGGSGGGGGGGGEAPDCDFSIEANPDTGRTCDAFSFTIITQPGCNRQAIWVAPSPYASLQTGSGWLFSTAWLLAGNHVVSATIGPRTRGTVVTVESRPDCTPTPAGPQTVLIGEPATYSYTQSGCFDLKWDSNGDTCPSTSTSNPWTTAFVRSGSQSVTLSGNDGCSFHTTAVRAVAVTPCSVSITGPTNGYAGTPVCFNAIPVNAATGTYLWSSPGGTPSAGGGPAFCTTFGTAGLRTVSVSLSKTVPGCASPSCGSASRSVTIAEPPPRVVINSPDPVSLLECQTTSLNATGTDGLGNPTVGTYTWSTSDASVVSITPGGALAQITGVSPGSVQIGVSFTTASGSATASITINVQGAAGL